MNTSAFLTTQQRLSAALVNSQRAYAAHMSTARRAADTAKSRQVAARTARDQGRRWAVAEGAAVSAAVADGRGIAPPEIVAALPAPAKWEKGTAPLPDPAQWEPTAAPVAGDSSFISHPSSFPQPVVDGRAGLSDARGQAEAARDSLRAEVETLRQWQMRRSKLLRLAGIALLLLLIGIGLALGGRAARETATAATAIAAATTASAAANPPATSPRPTSPTSIVLATAPVVLPGLNAPDEIVFQSNIDGDYEIYIMAAAGGERRALTDNNVDDKFPRVSPDGRKILFVSWRDGNQEIYVMNRDGRDQTRLTDHPADDELPAWSGAGRGITFQSDREGGYDIYVMSMDGGEPQRVIESPEREGHTSWSVDGRLAFDADADGYWQIYTAGGDGGNVRRITRSTYDEWSPEWSPDGQWLLFLSARDSRSNYGIYRMRPDGENVSLIFNSPMLEWGAVWSADGSQIVFAADQPDGTANLYAVSAAGGEARLLTERGGYPSWARAISVPGTVDAAGTAAGQEVTVRAATPRNETGINVSAGQYVAIWVVDGAWQAGPAPAWLLVGGEGDGWVPAKDTFPVPDHPLLTLIAGIGAGRPLAVGNRLEFVAGQSGALWLGANDDLFDDNSGALTVRVALGSHNPDEPATAAAAPTDPPSPSTATNCAVAVAARWAEWLWAEYRERLGCALGPPAQPDGAFQYFVQGTTIWREDADRIYVLYNSGAFAAYPDDLAPDEEYFVSERVKNGFGYLWQNDPVVQAGLGEPQAIEMEATDFIVQDFAGGTLIYFDDNGAYDFVLFGDDFSWLSFP